MTDGGGRPMTFEEQVEAVLVTQVRALTTDDECGDEDEQGTSCATFVARLLAPRVAAAIEAALHKGEASYGTRAYEAALEALRGSL